MEIKKNKFPEIPQRISGLPSLAYNLWWSWHAEARVLFKMLDRVSWKLSVHNPVKMLLTIDESYLQTAAKDQEFLSLYDKVVSHFNEDMRSMTGWFPKEHPIPEAEP